METSKDPNMEFELQAKDGNNKNKAQSSEEDTGTTKKEDEQLLYNSKPKEPERKRPRHWFKDNWVLLSILSLISFSTANLIIGTLAKLPGLQSVNYFCTGCIVFTIGYFIYNKECSKINPIGAKNAGLKKVLSRTWENNFDWGVLVFCIFSAGVQTCTFLSI